MEIYNHDLKGLLDRMVRFSEEAQKSVSAGSSELSDFDMGRLKSYLSAMSSYLDWVQGEPSLDLPESAPKPYTVADKPPEQEVESEIISDVCRLFSTCYEECAHSQSARRAAGLNKHDEGRLRAVIAKCESYLDNYVATSTPLDLPESSPAVAMSGPGRRGT